VRLRAGDWLVERFESLPTFAASEERVHTLDLRGRLTRLRLRLAETDGTALDRVHARVGIGSGPEGAGWIRGGRMELVVPAAARAITLRPSGFAAVVVEPIDEIQELLCTR
jgi:hypothetical protein